MPLRDEELYKDLDLSNFSPFTAAAEQAKRGVAPQTPPDTTGLPDDKATQLPEMDFSDPGGPSGLQDLNLQRGGGNEGPSQTVVPTGLTDVMHSQTPLETPDERAARKSAEHNEEVGSPMAAPKAAPADADYLSALKRIKDNLSKPTPDYAAQFQQAKAQDDSDNTFNRVLGFLNAAIRRSPTPDFGPAATHVSDLLKQQQLQQSTDNAQTDRLEKLATITKPKAPNAAEADLQKQRDYLVGIGAAKPEEVAGMGPAGLKTVYEHFGLKQRQDEKAKEDEQKAKELEADRGLLGKQFPGRDFTGLSRQGIGEAASIANADANQAMARAQFANTRHQQDLKQTEGLPANMEILAGANPAAEQLKDLGTVDRGADEVHRLADRMRQIIAKAGPVDRINPMSDAHRQLVQLQGELTLAIKDAGKLGQISQGDQALIDSIRPDAAGVVSVARDPASFDAQLKGMERLADDKRNAAMKSMGVRRRDVASGQSHGKVVKETKSVRQYEDGFLEAKT